MRERSVSVGGRALSPVILDVENIDFSFDSGRRVLSDVSFSLNQGETVGLSGPSGVGKSTLLEILAGLYPPERGTVRLEMKGTRDASLEHVGLVSQNVFLFSSTVRDNLTLTLLSGNPTDDQLYRSLEIVELDEFVGRVLGGLDCRVGEGGVPLSGGQLQRLGIARALVASPGVLLLDEATSAIEEELEIRILESIRREFPNLAMMVVSHRSTTQRLCDRVLTLSDGGVEVVAR